MQGTIVNTGAIIVGSLIGVAAGKRVPERFKSILMQALGLAVVIVGVRMALAGDSELLPVGSLLLGAVVGEAIRIEHWMTEVGIWLQKRLATDEGTFVKGFVSASILYVAGAMMLVGSIQDGTVGDPTVLYVKSVLDGVASLVLASTLGIGVAFSALTVFVAQGSVTLLSSQLLFLKTQVVLDAITATGGLMILGIGLNLLEVTKIRIGNLLPALFFAILGALYL